MNIITQVVVRLVIYSDQQLMKEWEMAKSEVVIIIVIIIAIVTIIVIVIVIVIIIIIVIIINEQ